MDPYSIQYGNIKTDATDTASIEVTDINKYIAFQDFCVEQNKYAFKCKVYLSRLTSEVCLKVIVMDSLLLMQ